MIRTIKKIAGRINEALCVIKVDVKIRPSKEMYKSAIE
jgi:hypothetical protein